MIICAYFSLFAGVVSVQHCRTDDGAAVVRIAGSSGRSDEGSDVEPVDGTTCVRIWPRAGSDPGAHTPLARLVTSDLGTEMFEHDRCLA